MIPIKIKILFELWKINRWYSGKIVKRLCKKNNIKIDYSDDTDPQTIFINTVPESVMLAIIDHEGDLNLTTDDSTIRDAITNIYSEIYYDIYDRYEKLCIPFNMIPQYEEDMIYFVSYKLKGLPGSHMIYEWSIYANKISEIEVNNNGHYEE